jgi:signal transduction histidine kinase
MPGSPAGDDNDGVDVANDSGGGRLAWPRRLPAARNATIAGAGVLALGAVIETLARGTGTGVVGLVVLLCVAGLATTLPLGMPNPNVAGGIVAAAGVLSLAILHTLTAAGCAAQLIAAYLVGRRGRPVLAVTVVAPYLLIVLTAARHPDVRIIGVLLASLIPAVALAATTQRMRREDRENRATRQAIAGTLLEHTARGERARIARELHDVVAHHISMVAVQAETARLTTPGMPAIGAQRLSAIGDTARAALTEMRRLLGVLREDTGTGTPDRRPQPSLRELNDLLDEARDATGTSTRLILHGPPVTLDPGVELAAYRIIQEALTNTRRHAPGAAVDVELHYTVAALGLTVRDNGPGPTTRSPAHGHGLLGMRERAAAVGGDLRTGAASTGGFLVEARLPTRPGDTR